VLEAEVVVLVENVADSVPQSNVLTISMPFGCRFRHVFTFRKRFLFLRPGRNNESSVDRRIRGR
jgi:hypothetical protein